MSASPFPLYSSRTSDLGTLNTGGVNFSQAFIACEQLGDINHLNNHLGPKSVMKPTVNPINTQGAATGAQAEMRLCDKHPCDRKGGKLEAWLEDRAFRARLFLPNQQAVINEELDKQSIERREWLRPRGHSNEEPFDPLELLDTLQAALNVDVMDSSTEEDKVDACLEDRSVGGKADGTHASLSTLQRKLAEQSEERHQWFRIGTDAV